MVGDVKQIEMKNQYYDLTAVPHAIDAPNGVTVKYCGSYKEALEYVECIDPQGMVDYVIRRIK